MTVFLTSSPYLDGAERAILNPENHFIERMREALPPFPRALLVASDPERHDLTCQFAVDNVVAFSIAGMPFSSFHVLDGTNAEDAGFLVENSDLIIFSGGHVPTQNAFLQEIGLAELMEGFEGTVMGISAGSMNCASTVYAQPEEEGESVDPDFERFLPGLGLTDLQILPHYQKVKDNIIDDQRLFEDVTYGDSEGNTFCALPDGSYVYISEFEETICGEAYRLRDGELEFAQGSGCEMSLEEFFED